MKLLKCDLLLFSVEHDEKLNIFGFWTVSQTKPFEDVTLDCLELLMDIFHYFLTFCAQNN